MNMQKACFGNRQFIQVLFFLTYNKPLDITIDTLNYGPYQRSKKNTKLQTT